MKISMCCTVTDAFTHFLPYLRGFPGGAVVESACQAGDKGEADSIPGVGRISLEEKMATHSSMLAWEIPWRGLASYSPPGVAKELQLSTHTPVFNSRKPLLVAIIVKLSDQNFKFNQVSNPPKIPLTSPQR